MQKKGMSFLSRLFIFCLLSLLPAGELLSQERSDSLRLNRSELPDSLLDLVTPLGFGAGGMAPISAASDPGLIGEGAAVSGPYTEKPMQQVAIPAYPIFVKGDFLPSWSNGYMYGSHRYSGNLLYGYMASANMGIVQNLGDYFTVTGGLSLNKYSVYYNTATFNGSITWHPNRHFALTAFGAYMPGSFLSPVNVGQAFVWGGYASLQTDTDVPFGIDLGAKDYYSTFTGHEVVPIVQPYIKIGESKLGFDFGPMIKNAIDRSNGHSGGGGFNPIPQPIKAVPRIAPRN